MRIISIIIIIFSYLSLLDVFRESGAYIVWYLLVLNFAAIGTFFIVSKKGVPTTYGIFYLYLLLVIFSGAINSLYFLTLGGIPKLMSFLLVGYWSFIILPEWINVSFNLRRFYLIFPVFMGVIMSIIAILGILEIPFFFELNNFDEKFPVMFLRSSSSMFFEPNIFALSLLIAWCLLDKLNFRISIRILIRLILLLGLLASYSRGAWAALVLYEFVKLGRRQKLMLLLFGVVALMYVLQEWAEDISEILVLSDILTGRPELWASILMNLDGFIIFGIGFDLTVINLFIVEIYGRDYVTSHNVFVDMLMTNGIFAFSSLVLLWVFTYLKTRDRKHLAVLLSLMFFLQFSPHNIGGASFLAIYISSIFGMSWRRDLI